MTPDPEPGWWRVRPRHYVGAFTLGDLRIIVQPKIKPENLFLLLEVGLRPEDWRAEAIDYADNHDLLAALVSFFARTAETTLARGLFHHYRHETDDLLALRGRMDFVRQFRRGGVLVPMACEWDDFTADVDENRCLAAAIRLALRVPDVPYDDRRRLRRLLAALDGVAEPTASAALECLDRIAYTRINEHYRAALMLAQLLLANCTLRDRHGHTAASAFMLDMNDLFEQFVTRRLQRELRALRAPHGPLSVAAQSSLYLDDEQRVQMRPDLTLRSGGETVGVADLKYKLAELAEYDASAPANTEMRARQGDWYQLLAYTTALDLREGTLVYCADVNPEEGSKRPPANGSSARPSPAASSIVKSTVTVRHTGMRLHAVGIDLSGSPNDIKDQIAALADHLATTCSEQHRQRTYAA
ncbi:McrC family protein [Candidatus Poriferisodalis sp.]|uniref:McrC family protein n=1 Tax=Candidatus Poriferisodalis sp. TaxID=3101277 RepID=UPI003B01121A